MCLTAGSCILVSRAMICRFRGGGSGLVSRAMICQSLPPGERMSDGGVPEMSVVDNQRHAPPHGEPPQRLMAGAPSTKISMGLC